MLPKLNHSTTLTPQTTPPILSHSTHATISETRPPMTSVPAPLKITSHSTVVLYPAKPPSPDLQSYIPILPNPVIHASKRKLQNGISRTSLLSLGRRRVIDSIIDSTAAA